MATLMLGKQGTDTLRSTNPAYRLREVDQTAPAGMWQIDAESGDLLFQASTNDTWTAFTTVVTMTSTPSITVHGTITFSGTVVFSANVRLDDDIVALFGDDSDYYMGYSATADVLEIGTGSTINSNVAMAVDSSGNVGMGTSSPSQKLEIITGSTTSSAFHLGEVAGGTDGEGLYISSTEPSNFYIGGGAEWVSDTLYARATNSAAVQSLDGELRFYTDTGLTDNDPFSPSRRMSIQSDGGIFMFALASGTGTALVRDGTTKEIYEDSSSIVYKDNVRTIDSDSTKVFDLNPVSFNWKRNGNSDFGLIAEEVAQVMPELVTYNNVGDPQSVRYDRLSVFLLMELDKIKKDLVAFTPSIYGDCSTPS